MIDQRRARTRAAPPIGALLALAAVLLLLLPASPARAHASLTGSDPVDGAVLDQSPDTVTLHFNEPVRPVADTMRLVDQYGRDHQVEASAIDLDVVVTVPPRLADGRYTLSWRVISADAHPISGVIAFAVGAGTPPPQPSGGTEADETDRTSVMAVGALHYLSLLVFAGFLFFQIAIARELRPTRPRHRVLRASGAAAIAATAASVPLDALALAGRPPSAVLELTAWSPTVRLETAGIAGLTAAGLVSAYWWFTRGRSRWAAPLALGSAAVAVFAPVLVGHSMLFGPRWLMIGADAVHLVTGAVWAGGLVGLVALLHRVRRSGGSGDTGEVAAVVARFSAWAGLTVALLAASGLTMAVLIHREWDGFLASDHGRLLLVKLGLVAVAVGLAAWNRFRLVPAIRGEPDRRTGLLRLRRIVLGEAAAVALAIAVTGTLVYLNPGGEEASNTTTVVTVREGLGSGEVTAVLSPGRTGANTLTFELSDPQGRPLVPLEDPEVLASLPEQDFGPISGAVAPEADGGYRADLDLPLSGTWEIEIHVRVSEFEHHVVTVTADLA